MSDKKAFAVQMMDRLFCIRATDASEAMAVAVLIVCGEFSDKGEPWHGEHVSTLITCVEEGDCDPDNQLYMLGEKAIEYCHERGWIERIEVQNES